MFFRVSLPMDAQRGLFNTTAGCGSLSKGTCARPRDAGMRPPFVSHTVVPGSGGDDVRRPRGVIRCPGVANDAVVLRERLHRLHPSLQRGRVPTVGTLQSVRVASILDELFGMRRAFC